MLCKSFTVLNKKDKVRKKRRKKYHIEYLYSTNKKLRALNRLSYRKKATYVMLRSEAT